MRRGDLRRVCAPSRFRGLGCHVRGVVVGRGALPVLEFETGPLPVAGPSSAGDAWASVRVRSWLTSCAVRLCDRIVNQAANSEVQLWVATHSAGRSAARDPSAWPRSTSEPIGSEAPLLSVVSVAQVSGSISALSAKIRPSTTPSWTISVQTRCSASSPVPSAGRARVCPAPCRAHGTDALFVFETDP